MTDIELLNIHKTLLDISETAALREIYNLGYCAGASVTPTATITDYSVAQSKPTDAQVAAVKQHGIPKR